MKASDVMTTDVITVKSNQTIQEVAELLLVKRISGVPVVDDSASSLGSSAKGTCSDAPMTACGRRPGVHPLVEDG